MNSFCRTACAVILSAFAMTQFANAQSMLPDKYLPTSIAKDPTYSTSIARLEVSGRDGKTYSAPLVAVAYDTALALHWWDIDSGEWKKISYGHAALTGVPPKAEPVAISNWSWSGEVGLVTVNKAVFLICKRQFGNGVGLQLRKYIWDNAARQLRPATASWIRLPFASFGYGKTGFHLWAGSAGGSVAVLTQAIKKVNNVDVPRLVLFVLRNADTANEANAGSWSSLDLDEGGWEFDGMTQGPILACVYRTAPYAVTLPITLPQASQDSTVLDLAANEVASFYSPLTLKEIDLSNLQVQHVEQNLPGGDHPRFQRWDPRYIAADRIRAGKISVLRIDVPGMAWETIPRVERFYPWARQAASRRSIPMQSPRRLQWRFPKFPKKPTYTITARISELEKTLLRRTPSGWVVGSLMGAPATVLPANLTHILPAEDMLFLVTIGTPSLQHATVQTPLPVFITNVTNRPQEKGEMIDVVYHRVKYESLFLSRFFVGTTGSILTMQERASEVLDLNHSQIGYWIEENVQFWRWDYESAPYVFQNPLVTVREEKSAVDNTIGGALTVELGGDRPRFMAYSDMGDGGARVVFNDSMPLPTPGPIASKGFAPENVAGTAAAVDTFIDIVQNGSWEPAKLPSYSVWAPNQAIVTELDPSLDLLRFWTEGCGDGACDITEEGLNFLEGLFHELNQSAENAAVSEASGDMVQAQFSYSPPNPFSDNKTRFRAKSTLAPQDISEYTWDFGDGSPPVSQPNPEIMHAFHLPLELIDSFYTVRLTITGTSGAVAVSEGSVSVRERLWTSLWRQHESFQVPGLARVGDISFSLSKYDIEYVVEDERPSRVALTVKPEYRAEFKFVVNPYGQGYVDLRLPLEAESKDIKLLGLPGTFYSVDKVHFSMVVQERFTPCVLTRENRGTDPLTGDFSPGDLLGPNVTALACKPIESLPAERAVVDIDGSLTWRTIGLLGLVSALTIIGLVYLAVHISTQIAAAFAALTSSIWGWVIAIAIMLVLIAFIEGTVEWAVEGYIENKVSEYTETSGMVDDLSESLLGNSGEGLAEALAVKAISLAEQHPPEASGINRFRDQYWQMIYVQDKKCRIWLRR